MSSAQIIEVHPLTLQATLCVATQTHIIDDREKRGIHNLGLNSSNSSIPSLLSSPIFATLLFQQKKHRSFLKLLCFKTMVLQLKINNSTAHIFVAGN